MSENNPLRASNVLSGDDTLELWRSGRREWNDWVDAHPDWEISFAYADFARESQRRTVLDFSGYRFGNGDLSFADANFGDRDLIFKSANFGDGKVDFSGANFGDGRADFSSTTFGNSEVIFYQSTFGRGVKTFLGSTFGKGKLDFLETNFGDGDLDFFDVDFGEVEVFLSDTVIGSGQLILAKSRVSNLLLSPKTHKLKSIAARGLLVRQWATIELLDGRSLKSLDLQGAAFDGSVFISGELDIVPDLRSIRSAHQIELGELKIKLRRLPNSNNWIKRLHLRAEDFEDAARLRRLKEIAEANKDHQAALRFAADENRARRWIETSWPGAILDISFSAFSDYGQNILRPFNSLILLTLTSVGLYKAFSTAEMLTQETSWGHATTLAASNSLPFLPQSRGIRDDAIEALYSNDPSLLVDAIMIGQGALSFIFLFLIGLGLRNRFRL